MDIKAFEQNAINAYKHATQSRDESVRKEILEKFGFDWEDINKPIKLSNGYLYLHFMDNTIDYKIEIKPICPKCKQHTLISPYYVKTLEDIGACLSHDYTCNACKIS